MKKVLFILKRRAEYGVEQSYSYSNFATGMWNSSKFVSDVLAEAGAETEVTIVDDSNQIDAVCTAYNPDIVIIEGLWVPPSKFIELKGLPRHAAKKFVVRIHSDFPFLATEGVAMEWISSYLNIEVQVAPNDQRTVNGLRRVFTSEDLILLPNCYPIQDFTVPVAKIDRDQIDIGCFGALRPLKNQLIQAIAAIEFAKLNSKKLRFHINDRVDAGGNNISRNLRGLFAGIDSDIAELVVHGWEDRQQFLESLSNLDILMQVSLSETFNIVAADSISVGTPVLGSSEIPWLYPLVANPNDVHDMVTKLDAVWKLRSFNITKNREHLRTYCSASSAAWVQFAA